MSCGNPGRCCNGPDCSTNVGACKCRCEGTDWSADNLCTAGACWLLENGAYTCAQLNPCDCIYQGGEFSGPGTSCPDDGSGPPPPAPPPPPPEDPGPVVVYCCDNTNGVCSTGPGYCAPWQTRYWSAEQCNAGCYPFGPPPDPDPDPDPVGPCDPPCGPCQDCVNGACVNRCDPSKCCNGVCCAANETCVNGVCVASCSGSCTWQSNSPGGVDRWEQRTYCVPATCTCAEPAIPPPQGGGTTTTTPCTSNAFP